MSYPTIDQIIGNTPLVKLQRLTQGHNNTILLKLEGTNPGGSVKDRAAFNMIKQAQERGEIAPGDTLIEATSGNTGIALAMVAAIAGYKMILIMPDNMSAERRQTMAVYGAQLVLVSEEASMEGARDLALHMQQQGKGKVLNQFANQDNPLAHYTGTAVEIWQQTQGNITHFISSMGTTGTIVGSSKFFKEKNLNIQIIGLQPAENAKIPGIRRWPTEYLPSIFDATNIDTIEEVGQQDAETTAKLLAQQEGIFAGVSSGAAVFAAIELSKKLSDATIVAIVCDRGDRYLSTGVFAD
jgi:S-sulfo-L-cysteine synthase (O-acetyl-L-serine-dependent)